MITLFDVYHALLPQKKYDSNIKYVYDKTSPKKHQNTNLSVNFITSYIITHIFGTEIFSNVTCSRCSAMFFNTELRVFQS
jgi:hypothetical protein